MNRIIKVLVSICFFCFITAHCLAADTGQDKSSGKADIISKLEIGFTANVLGDLDIRDARSAIVLWVEEIGQKIGFQVKGRIIEEMDTITKMINTGVLDLAVASVLDYLKVKEQINAEVFFGGIYENAKTKKYIVLVHSKDDAATIKDIKAGNLAITQQDSLGRLFLDTLLLRSRLQETDKFFASVIEKKKHSQAVLAVFFKRADICVVPDTVFDTMVELNPQIGKNLRIIASSQPMFDKIGLLRRDYNENNKAPVIHSALELHKTSRGKQVLMLFKMYRLTKINESDLDSVRALLDEYNRLKEDIEVQKR